MQSLRIYCSRCGRNDTEAVREEISKLCREFGIGLGIAQLAAIARDLLEERTAAKLKPEHKEVANQVALRILTFMDGEYLCESCRAKIARDDRKQALRRQFRIVTSKRSPEPSRE